MKKRRGLAYRGSSRTTRHRSVPHLERVEDRILMAIFDVTSTNDNPRNVAAGDGTLRGEILASNATTTANEIDFMLPNGVQTIRLQSPLPAFTETLFINGSTATGYSGTPLIQITGTNPQFQAAGPAFSVNAKNSVISDLVINNFAGDGIDLNAPNSTVDGCYIGLDPTGTLAEPNTQDGILVASADNTIGFSSTGQGNVIAANGGNQIEINGTNAGGNVVTGNYVGTNATGTAAVFSNVPGDGIAVSTAGNIIGAAQTINGFFGVGQGNLISGNENGLDLFAGATDNVVEGNFIGTDHTGTSPLPNVDFGVYVNGGTRNQIGSVDAFFDIAYGNVISGNGNDGVRIQGAASTGNLVQGNNIGIGSDGLTAVGNGHWGVNVNGASGNLVGGTTFQGDAPVFGNIIQDNDTLGGAGGVTIVSATNDGILSNSIYTNGNGPGIQLNGGNNGIAAPVITSAQSGAGETEITGTYTGAPNTTYFIQFFSSVMANASGVGDGQNYLLGDLSNVKTNSLGNATFSTIAPLVPVGYVLTATATQGVLVMNNTSDFSRAEEVVQAVVSDLSITTSVSTTGPQLDQPYTYTLMATNSGPDPSADAVVTDTLPTNSTVVSVSGGTVTGGVLTDDLGPLAVNATDTITIVVKPTLTGAFTNTATITGPELDPDLTNNTSTTTSNVVPDADLEVTLTPSTTMAPVGSPLTYTLLIGNNGPSTATGTVVMVQFPADFTNITVMPDQGSYTINTSNLVTLNTGIVPASSSNNVTFTATPTMVDMAGSTSNTTATVSSPVADPNPNNNTSTAAVTVANAADLGVTMTASPNPVLIGQELVYTIDLTNNGPSPAGDPVVTDPLPAGVTFDQSNSSAGPNGTFSVSGGVVTWASTGNLLAGGSDTITIAVVPMASGLITNTVTASNLANPAEIDPNLTNNVATVTVPVSPADVSVNVDNPSDPLFIGKGAVFQIQVYNSGPAVATNVTLTDAFSAGGDIVQVSTGNFSGMNYSANLGNFAPGQSETVYIIVDPQTSGPLTNSAGVSADQYDPDTSNNTSSATNLVSPVALSVSVAGAVAPILYGGSSLYVVTVTNNGPAPATNVQFADTLPSNAILAGLVSSQGSVAPNAAYTNVYGNLGTLAPGASATVSIDMVPLATGPATNIAAVGSDDYNTSPSNSVSYFTASVINLPGQIQFVSTQEAVADNAGSITLLAERINGTLGTVSATYYTLNYTAVAGTNYVGTLGTVTFAPGQSFAAITIPILNDGFVNPNLGFLVALTAPTGGASLGTQGITGVIVVNTNRDTIPPIVSSLLAIPNGNSIEGFALTFDKAMDPTEASLLSNYSVVLTGAGAVNVGTPVPLIAAEYNASNNTVILVPAALLPSNRFYEIVANGTTGNFLHDTSGNPLYGSSGVGSNYVAYYGQGTNLVYDDAQNNQVTLTISGGGIMGIYRQANGDATLVDLYGIVPHSTKLSGSVVKLGKNSSGTTYIGAINGFGQFGDVNSTLTTPEFYVGSAPVTASAVKVSAESVSTTPAVTTSKATPKGPKKPKT
jgi:uncharacterized repeat protein (TIGR01451 family)